MGFIIITAVFVLVLHLALHGLLRLTLTNKKSRLPWLCLLINVLSLVAMGMMFKPQSHSPWEQPVIQAITIWLMLQLLTIVLLLALNLVRFAYRKINSVPVDESRRKFAKAAMAVPVAAAGASLYGAFVEKDGLAIRHFQFPVEGLGSRVEGVSIAQISDVHLGPFFDLEDLQRLLERAAEEKPDMLTITGDLFDDNKTTMQAAKLVDSFVESFPLGIYYCRGNHEHFRSIPLVEIALGDTKIHNLVNSHVQVVEDSRPLYIAGVDYPMDREQFDYLQEAYTKNAMENIPAHAVKILLAHHPDFLDSAVQYDTELVLSGHTHGGQLGFLGIPLVPPVFKYMRGWYKKGKSALYVHCGNGSWFPFRLGCPPELAIFHLTRKA